MPKATLDAAAQDILFRTARSQNGWKPEKIPEDILREMYDLMKMGPTSANCCPARFVFVISQEAKEKLKQGLAPGNYDKTMSAPVTAIIGYDTKFYELLPELFLHADMRPLFTSNPTFAEESAFRNSSLQGAYFMMAARALGYDVGPMSGFNPAKVNELFFPDGQVKVNFLCNIGIGDESKLFGRSPRLPFERFCTVL